MLKSTIIGTLGDDAEYHISKNMLRMSVVHTDYGVDQDGKKTENNVWVNVHLKGDGGNRRQHLLKGSKIYAYGRLYVSTYLNQRGNSALNITIVATELEIIAFAKSKDADKQTNDYTIEN